MKKFSLTVISLLLVFCLSFVFCGVPASADQENPNSELPIRIAVLNGTTGFGMAGLMARQAEGDTALNYSFTVDTDASNISAALINGDCDIAALPTNAASALYNKTQGQIRVLALNTRGVLYLLSDGEAEIKTISDLDGQTVYVPAQNPSFILAYLCDANGIHVTIDNTYAQPAELNAALASGAVHLAVLPEPMVTIALAKNSALQVQLDLTEEWDRVSEPGSLVQGCVVVTSSFAEEHSAELAAFLVDYEQSVELLLADPAAAARDIESAGIFAQAAVAEKAIPNCNVCFVIGEEMKTQLSAFLEIMFAAAPQSIGGALPADDFYCILK